MAAGIDLQGEWKNGAVLTATVLMLAGGLLVLVGVFSAARPALAQAQEACPLPAGVTPPAVPRVTAQQVEDGSASLMDFALAVRDQFGQGTTTEPQRTLYVGCLIRQEGSPYRSGSTYLVTLRLDGRVFVHAKAMRLSGRQLNPLIFAEILSALGVEPTVLADLASPDPGVRRRAVAAVQQTLLQEPAAPFDATVPIPDVRPGIPGASGYAAVYVSGKFGTPVVLLAGFDLDMSHLVEEDIDPGDPAITAADVVGRRTLKAFVTQAGEFVLALARQQNGDILKAKNVMRDPEGPWRHGSVYLYILDVQNNIVLFHATQPDLLELYPLVGRARDGRTGELILPRVLAAAKSNPEGNFVEYHYDDPADDSDSADIPKVGYAREFTGSFRRNDGAVFSINFIVGSGFYPSAGALGGELENPGPASSQSGTGALWGWVCHAELVEIEIEPEQGEVTRYVAAYGTERPDTLERCGDVDNGFELVFNWNRLGDGEHTVTALVDGVELGRATVWVTTLGAEVLEGVEGECVAGNFPHSGQTVTLEWQETNQNFVITEVQ